MRNNSESSALTDALERINRTPEAQKLHDAATNTHDLKAIDGLRDLVHGDFARLNEGTAVTALPDQTELTLEQVEEAVSLLKRRFNDEGNKKLCPTLSWERAERTLRATPKALETALKAEQAGHIPTICFSDETGFEIATRSDETPESTRNYVYDEEGEQLRKKTYPDDQFNDNAVSQARKMGWDIQEIELANHIAAKTAPYAEQGASWFKTDPKTRKKSGGAFVGVRYSGGGVHGARSGAHERVVNRGWRGSLSVNFVD